MAITTTNLTRAAAVSAVAAGLLFGAVQIKHPNLDANFVTTTEWTVRESAKILMAVLSLAGITGMYLRQVTQTKLLGLAGYVVFSIGYLAILGVEIIGVTVLPVLARSQPGYVNDVLAVATGGQAAGDIGLVQPLCMVMGLTFLGGGLLFGIALFRARILARWAAALLGAGSLATAAIPLLPQINERVFAIPTAVAMAGLGVSLWRDQRTPATQHTTSSASAQPTPAGIQ